MMHHLKEKLVGSTGSVSGAASVLGSWQVCHNICLGLIALLGVIGITVVGMPLLFLTKVATPMWTAASLLLLVTIALYFKKRCISKRLIQVNAGLIVAGVPFQPLQEFSVWLWLIGGSIVLSGIALFIRDKIIHRSKDRSKVRKKECGMEKKKRGTMGQKS